MLSEALPAYFGGSWAVAVAWCYVLLLSGMGARHLAQWARRAARLAYRRLRALRQYLPTLRHIVRTAGHLVAPAGNYQWPYGNLDELTASTDPKAKNGWAGATGMPQAFNPARYMQERYGDLVDYQGHVPNARLRNEMAGQNHPFAFCARRLRQAGYTQGRAQKKCAAVKDSMR